MLLNDPTYLVQLSSPKAMVACKRERFKPELAGAHLPLDMHVRGFVAVETREEEAIGSGDPGDSWHSRLFLQPQA